MIPLLFKSGPGRSRQSLIDHDCILVKHTWGYIPMGICLKTGKRGWLSLWEEDRTDPSGLSCIACKTFTVQRILWALRNSLELVRRSLQLTTRGRTIWWRRGLLLTMVCIISLSSSSISHPLEFSFAATHQRIWFAQRKFLFAPLAWRGFRV
jgi:hypothetical protein